MKIFDLQQEVYRPLWLRAAITVACLGWAVVEFASGTPLWGVLFAAIGAYAAHQFFIAFDPQGPDERDGKE